MNYFNEIDLSRMPFSKGAFGMVVRCNPGKALKLFFKRSTNPPTLIKDTFDGEVEAYKIASTDQNLVKLIPKFYGCAGVGKVLDKAGNDVSNLFELDMGYVMEWVEGDFVKLDQATPSQKDAIAESFKKAGIRYVRDASCLICEGKIKFLIDFSVDEIEELWVEDDGHF